MYVFIPMSLRIFPRISYAAIVMKYSYFLRGTYFGNIHILHNTRKIVISKLSNLYDEFCLWGSPDSTNCKVQRADLTCHVIRNSLRLCCVDQSGTSIQILPEPRATFFIKLRLYSLELFLIIKGESYYWAR